MKKKNLAKKLYEKFTPEERLQLVIEAKARKDDEEIGRLKAPRSFKTNTQKDITFAIPLKVAYDIVQVACQELDLARGKLEMVQSFQLFFQLLTITFEQWSESKTEGEEGCFEEIREIFETLSEALINNFRRQTIILIKVTLEALAGFCMSKLSLDSGTVLKAFAESYWKWLEGLQDEIAMAEAPPADVAAYEKVLIEGWDKRIAMGM